MKSLVTSREANLTGLSVNADEGRSADIAIMYSYYGNSGCFTLATAISSHNTTPFRCFMLSRSLNFKSSANLYCLGSGRDKRASCWRFREDVIAHYAMRKLGGLIESFDTASWRGNSYLSPREFGERPSLINTASEMRVDGPVSIVTFKKYKVREL